MSRLLLTEKEGIIYLRGHTFRPSFAITTTMLYTHVLKNLGLAIRSAIDQE